MKIIEPSVKVVNVSSDDPIGLIAKCARVSHQSHNSNDEELIRKLIRLGHMSVFEHVSMTIEFITDIKIAMALLRHRFISVTQESTRYCNYTDHIKFPDGFSVICPSEIKKNEGEPLYVTWESGLSVAEDVYNRLIKTNITPEAARSVLPMCTATQTMITANLREWKHIIETRISYANHKDMIKIAKMLKTECQNAVPIIFD